jgi:hypothetical protein
MRSLPLSHWRAAGRFFSASRLQSLACVRARSFGPGQSVRLPAHEKRPAQWRATFALRLSQHVFEFSICGPLLCLRAPHPFGFSGGRGFSRDIKTRRQAITAALPHPPFTNHKSQVTNHGFYSTHRPGNRPRNLLKTSDRCTSTRHNFSIFRAHHLEFPGRNIAPNLVEIHQRRAKTTTEPVSGSSPKAGGSTQVAQSASVSTEPARGQNGSGLAEHLIVVDMAGLACQGAPVTKDPTFAPVRRPLEGRLPT